MTGQAPATPVLDGEARYRALLTDTTLIRGGRIQPVWLADAVAYLDQAGPGAMLKIVERATGRTRLERPAVEIMGELAAGSSPALLAAPGGGLLLVAGSAAFHVSPDDGAARALSAEELALVAGRTPRQTRPWYPTTLPPEMEALSPDGAWALTLEDHDVWLRPTAGGAPRRITCAGLADPRWSTYGAAWSPDGRRVALMRVDERGVARVPLVDWTGDSSRIDWRVHPRADGAIAVWTIHLVDVESGQVTAIGGGDEDHFAYIQGFSADGLRLRYARLERTAKDVELLAYEIETGRTQLLLRETSKTFLYWPPTFILGGAPVRFLSDGRFLWMTERSGWNQIWLHEADGSGARPLTDAGWPVTGIAGVDEASATVFFRGQPDPDRPYDVQLFRVSLSGGPPVQLSLADGVHEMSLAPDGAHYVDVHSSVERAPGSELRAADGGLAATLSQADVSGLAALGWEPPERLRLTAADGTTQLHGVLYKPYDFDPMRSYPVIEQIYAGPQSILTPHAFGIVPPAAFAQLGYVVVILDGRGTPGRGKAFQDVAVGQMGEYEIADHAGALRQAAASRPWMDLSRVGIFGGSYGGYFAIRALIQAPELYKAAVAMAPAELGPGIMSLPVECYAGRPADHPERWARLGNTDKLEAVRGELLIISAADDINTPLEQTMLYAEALVRLQKPFDQVVIPGCNHVMLSARGEPQLAFTHAVTMRHFARTLGPGSLGA